MRNIVAIICFLLTSFSVFSTEIVGGGYSANRPDSSLTEHFAIYYRFDRTDFDESYLTNGETAAHIRKYLQNSPRIDSIIVYAWSSPDGAYRHNVWLARERAKTARQFLLDLSPDSLRLDSKKIHISPQSENWPGLLKLVETRYTRHDREKVLKILKDTKISDETRKWRLKQLDGGYTWSFLYRKYMPQLRSATWICVWAEVIEPLPEAPRLQTFATVSKPAVPAPIPSEPSDSRPQTSSAGQAADTGMAGIPVASVRTNLLVPGLNFGAQVPLGNNWSVGADYYYPWIWPGKTNKNCFEFLGWSVEGRYWFGKDRMPSDRLKGHSVGIYTAAGYYDFERDFRGLQGEFISAGADYTYALPIGRRKRVNLEFTLALGYIHAWNKTYSVPGPEADLYPDEGTMMFDYFGPTKAAVSIVVPIFRKEGGR